MSVAWSGDVNVIRMVRDPLLGIGNNYKDQIVWNLALQDKSVFSTNYYVL